MKFFVKSNYIRLIIWSFLLFILSVTIAFIWSEIDSLSLKLTINDDKVANYFTSVGAVGSILALILLYLQLKEMEAQRKEKNLPELFIRQGEFKVADADLSRIGISGISVVTINIGASKLDSGDVPYLILENLGNGAAKDIVVIWKYSKEEVAAIVNDKYQIHTDIYLQLTFDKVIVPEINHYDAIRASSEIKISAPHYYLNCCGLQLNKTESDYQLQFHSGKPQLSVEIFYKTIDNQSFKGDYNAIVTAIGNGLLIKFIRYSHKSVSKKEIQDILRKFKNFT